MTATRSFVKKLTERRREVNARLAAEDAKNRCAECRIALPDPPLQVMETGLKYCSTACLPAQGRASE